MSNESDYPLPSHCAGIWTNGMEVLVSFPGTGGSRGHTVRLPLDKLNVPDGAAFAGWRILRDLLFARMRSENETQRTIGTRGAPVQYDLEVMLRSMRKEATRYDRSGAVEVEAPSWEDL